MIKNIVISVFSCLVAFQVFAGTSTEKNSVGDYAKRAEQLLSLTEKAPFSEIQKATMEVVAISKPILSKFLKKHSECKDYLTAALDASDKMMTLPLEQIEMDYHADGALPPAPIKCYHAKDLLVHAATVGVLAIQKDTPQVRSQMKDEILEVLEHVKDVEKNLK